MVQAKPRRKVIKALAKGQITIPNEFREALGIDAETEYEIETRPVTYGYDGRVIKELF